MSEEEKKESTEAADDKKANEKKPSPLSGVMATASGVVSKIIKLKDEKPKLFYRGIAGIVVILIIISFFGGGNPEVISERVEKNLVIGGSYVLRNPNAAGDQAMTSLVKEPGSLQGYDRSMNDDLYICLAPAGTRVTILQFMDAFGTPKLFAEVEVNSPGECLGKKGWTLVNNILQG